MIEIERLDRRVHLSTTKLADAGGLPRQLTAVGDTVYFAVDSKADGHLSYVDLTAYNVKTKARASIRRADGTKFGNVEYTLASVDNRLRITELLGKGKTAVWSLKPGDSKAKKYAAPKSPVSKDLAAGYAATATPWTNRTAFVSDRGVYTLNASTGKTYAVSVPFEKHLDHIVSLGAVGDKLIVDAVHKEGEKLYVVDRTTGVGARFRVSGTAGDTWVLHTTTTGLLVEAKVGENLQLFLTDGTTPGTKALDTVAPGSYDTTFAPSLSASSSFVQTDDHTLYLAPFGVVNRPVDPETLGPYQNPFDGTSGDQISDTLAEFTYLYRLDTSTGVLTEAAVGGTGGTGELKQIDNSLYYLTGTWSGTGDTNSSVSLNRLDLPTGRTDSLGDFAGNVVFADNEPIFAASFQATSVVTATPTLGTLDAFVTLDNDRAKLLTPGDDDFYASVYVDLNKNGRFDANEPSSVYSSLAANLKPGRYVVRLNAPGAGWVATRGWSKTVTVRAGTTTSTAFGLADGLATSTLFIKADGISKGSTRGTTGWLDLNNDGLLDGSEQLVTFDSKDSVLITGLRVGSYVFRYANASYSYSFRAPGQQIRTDVKA